MWRVPKSYFGKEGRFFIMPPTTLTLIGVALLVAAGGKDPNKDESQLYGPWQLVETAIGDKVTKPEESVVYHFEEKRLQVVNGIRSQQWLDWDPYPRSSPSSIYTRDQKTGEERQYLYRRGREQTLELHFNALDPKNRPRDFFKDGDTSASRGVILLRYKDPRIARKESELLGTWTLKEWHRDGKLVEQDSDVQYLFKPSRFELLIDGEVKLRKNWIPDATRSPKSLQIDRASIDSDSAELHYTGHIYRLEGDTLWIQRFDAEHNPGPAEFQKATTRGITTLRLERKENKE